ncbi:AMP-binding protein [Actinoplanes sp. NPDC051411]|uniref:AMP-binding protein n=1 Tax=Actinoplanes sp. NPDC051411 TaxID=3155522 RepID=UPI0034136E12
MAEVARPLAQRADERPDATAYVSGPDGRTLTWADLARRAARPRALNLAPQARIGLSTADPLEFAALYLGLLAAGRTVVPLDPRLTPHEREAAVVRLRVDLTLPDNSVRGDARLPHGHVIEPPAVLLTSSGTTRHPKGIALSEAQLVAAARRVARHHGLGPGDRGYSPLPLFHVNAQVMGLLVALVSGASLVLDPRFDAGSYWDRVEQWRPTWLNTVPAILAALAARTGPPSPVAERIRFARSASAPLPVPVSRAFTAATGISVLQTYGMTEAAGQITANPLDPSARREGSVGRPVGVDLVVLGPEGQLLPPGETGMVALHGPAVTAHRRRLVEQRKLRVLSGPSSRFEGTAEEHRTIFLVDPSHNVPEFKQYEDPRLQF